MKTQSTRVQLIDDVLMVKEKIGEIPSSQHYHEHGSFSVSTVKRRFGSWNKLLGEVFGEIRLRHSIPRVQVKCGNPKCEKFIVVKETETDTRFCCVSCSNSGKPRRNRKVWPCRSCGKPSEYRRYFCGSCLESKTIENRTLDSFRVNGSDANRYRQIREHAVKIGTALPDKCAVCGYDKHSPVCHRKAIGSFSGETLIREINALSNLVKLCPTHHWEFDHGLLIL